MKILFFSHDSVYYGAPQALFELVKMLVYEYNMDCIVVTPKQGMLNEKLDEIKIENYSIKYFWEIKDPKNSLCKNIVKRIRNNIVSKVTLFKIKKIIDIDKIDLVHTNTSVIDIGAKFCKKYKIPHIWHVRESLEEHFGLKYLKKKNTEYIINNSKFVITISKKIKGMYVENKSAEEKIKLIYDGIDKNRFMNNVIKDKSKDILKCVFVGKIYEQKGQLQVVKAISLLPEDIKKSIIVDFYGDYEESYYKKIKSFIVKNDLENNFNFKGYIENVNEILGQYNVGFVCSKCEGFGRTTVEYMLSEVCPIVSDTGANTELVINKKNGLIYKYNDINCLAKKIIFCYENKNTVKEMAKKSRIRALSNYTLDGHVKKVVELFNRAMIK